MKFCLDVNIFCVNNWPNFLNIIFALVAIFFHDTFLEQESFFIEAIFLRQTFVLIVWKLWKRASQMDVRATQGLFLDRRRKRG
jgi:hypothetical protein